MSEETRGYTIKVAAQLSGLHEQSLRLYERRGLVTPARSKGNIRRYSDADIEQIRLIKRLVDDLGVNLAGVEVIIQLRRQIIDLRAELSSGERRG
jgi:MerR family transcriptional regulator, heat shock protein HspR